MKAIISKIAVSDLLIFAALAGIIFTAVNAVLFV